MRGCSAGSRPLPGGTPRETGCNESPRDPFFPALCLLSVAMRQSAQRQTCPQPRVTRSHHAGRQPGQKGRQDAAGYGRGGGRPASSTKALEPGLGVCAAAACRLGVSAPFLAVVAETLAPGSSPPDRSRQGRGLRGHHEISCSFSLSFFEGPGPPPGAFI